MTELWICVTVCAAAVLIAAGVILWNRRKTRKLMETMDRILDAAIDGSFLEAHFDESLLSALETKLAHYLSASEVSAENLTAEKEKIKELIGDISHQTRTPLANILLYGQLLAEQELPQGARDCVEPLNAQAEKLRFLIEALVKTSRLETGIFSLHTQCASVSELLQRTARQVAPLAAEKQISLTCMDSDAKAQFDPKWTAEALYNLLDNAVKYTPPGGSITVQAQPYELFCRISVTDSGTGIDEAEQAKIFSRFYRSPAVAQQPGVGIGLYLAREIAAAEGGYLRVESAPGRGSTFSLFLPAVP